MWCAQIIWTNIKVAFLKLTSVPPRCPALGTYATPEAQAQAGFVHGDSMDEVWKQATLHLRVASIHFSLPGVKTGNAEEKLKLSMWHLMIQAPTSAWAVPHSLTERSFQSQTPPPDFNVPCNNKNPRTNHKDPTPKN